MNYTEWTIVKAAAQIIQGALSDHSPLFYLPTSPTVSFLGTYNVGDGPYGICFDGANIWVSNYYNDTVTKL